MQNRHELIEEAKEFYRILTDEQNMYLMKMEKGLTNEERDRYHQNNRMRAELGDILRKAGAFI